MGQRVIYLDANATSRIRPEAEAVLFEVLKQQSRFRNASSVHRQGREARALLKEARRSVVQLLSRGQENSIEVVFTSGGTESCNQIIFGFLGTPLEYAKRVGHVVASAFEHPAISQPLSLLEAHGWEVTRIAPNSQGVVEVGDFLSAIRADTALVTLMAANNESGALQPVAELARALGANGYCGPIVSDITQAFGKSSISVAELFEAGVTAVAASGHKLGAPVGVGIVAYSSESEKICFPFHSILFGGPQESGFRPGTENVVGAAALGAVCLSLAKNLDSELKERAALRDLLWNSIRTYVPDAIRLGPHSDTVIPGLSNGHQAERTVCNTLLVQFPGCRADDLVVSLDINGVAASTGSACSSGKQGVSEAAVAMGLDTNSAKEVVRFSIDWDGNELEITRASEIIARSVKQMRSFAVAGADDEILLPTEVNG